MCTLGVSNRWIPLEVRHKGALHELSKFVQETQQDTDSGMEVSNFV